MSNPGLIFGSSGRISLPKRSIESTTNIGMRPAQEDRVVLCPKLCEKVTLGCVFDGTVGFEASEFCQKNIVKNMNVDHPDFEFLKSTEDGEVDESVIVDRMKKVEMLLRDSFLRTDQQFIEYCKKKGGLDFASSTGVSVMAWHHNMITSAFVGDSRACLCKVDPVTNVMQCEWITTDHKADQPAELKRIQEAGGSLVYLHGNKPFIRGGDFLKRQAAGEHPKQLNYSRAFGGKDLKPYGLSVEPGITHKKLVPKEDRFVLIASDGLWDTLPLRNICDVAWNALERNKGKAKKSSDAALISDEVISVALQHMPMSPVRDNISCVAIVFNWDD